MMTVDDVPDTPRPDAPQPGVDTPSQSEPKPQPEPQPDDDDAVDRADRDSFPASDPPSWTGGTPRRPVPD